MSSDMILVQLRNSGQVALYQAGNLVLKAGDCVIVEHDRGLDYGQIVTACQCQIDKEPKDPLK